MINIKMLKNKTRSFENKYKQISLLFVYVLLVCCFEDVLILKRHK